MHRAANILRPEPLRPRFGQRGEVVAEGLARPEFRKASRLVTDGDELVVGRFRQLVLRPGEEDDPDVAANRQRIEEPGEGLRRGPEKELRAQENRVGLHASDLLGNRRLHRLGTRGGLHEGGGAVDEALAERGVSPLAADRREVVHASLAQRQAVGQRNRWIEDEPVRARPICR